MTLLMFVCVCVCVVADANPEVVQHKRCVSAAMRADADTSMRQCIFLLISIAQHVIALHVFKSLCVLVPLLCYPPYISSGHW